MYEYKRQETVAYAKKWALRRNPRYYNFDGIGGDCTNFASQCLFAGSKIMNYKRDIGWYYNSINDRAAAWSDANFLNIFLSNNKGIGPIAEKVSIDKIETGDLIQLSDGEKFYHSIIVTGVQNEMIYVSAHTEDTFMIPLELYHPEFFEYIHIIGINFY